MNENVLLKWDQTGERYFEAGVSRGVVYPHSTNTGVVWNGLTAVNETSEGGEPNAIYADDIKYLNLLSNEDFGATIEAYTYPEEFEECDGSAPIAANAKGILVTQQPRKPFDFSYVRKVGNDEDGIEHGYKINLVYNALAAPSDKNSETIGDGDIDPTSFSWDVSTTPVAIPGGLKPTAHLVIDSRKFETEQEKAILSQIEGILYGHTEVNSETQESTEVAPRMPTPAELIALFSGNNG